MLLIALLLFCKVIDDMDLKTLGQDAGLPVKITNNILQAEESLKQGKISESNAVKLPAENGNLPPLVPFEFPADFYQNRGRKIVEAVEVKMAKFFGSSHANEVKNFDTAEGMLEYLSNVDFNNAIVNSIVRKCITYLKPTENQPLEGIVDKKSCKTACRKNLGAPIAFVHRVFQNFISQVTNEDLRFRIYQDPKKGYEFSTGRGKNKNCKCLDKGYQVKVSPRLLEIIDSKFNDANGLNLAEQLEEENSVEDLANAGGHFSLRKMANLALYFSGFSSTSKSRWGGGNPYYNDGYRYKKDPVDFIVSHLLLNIFLFIFCHCLWYFHIVYFFLIFITEYIL